MYKFAIVSVCTDYFKFACVCSCVCVCKCVNDFTSSEQNQRNLACGSTSAITASSLCDMFSSQTDPEEKETQEGS